MTAMRKVHAVRAESAGSRRQRYVLSTPAVDSYGDRIVQSGWDLSRYGQRPIVLWSHDHAVPAIGKTVEIGVVNGALKATMEYPPAGLHPLADTIYGLTEAGIVPSCSVGFNSLERVPNSHGGYDHLRSELVEWSICNLGANHEALREPVGRAVDRAALTRWLATGARGGRADLAEVFAPGSYACDAEGRALDDDVLVFDLDELLGRKEPVMGLAEHPAYAIDRFQQGQRDQRMLPAQRERLAASLAWNAETLRQRHQQMGVGTDAMTGVTKGEMLQVMHEVVGEIAGPIVARRLRQMAGRLP